MNNFLKNKKLLTGLGISAVVLVVAAAGYWYYQYYQKSRRAGEANAIRQAGGAAEDLSEKASQGTLPSINPGSNPMGNAPDTNPVSKTNPFSGIKINPFK